MTTIISTTCQQCGCEIEIIPIGTIETGLCDKCCNVQTQHIAESKQCAFHRLAWLRWTENFAIYRRSDFYKLPQQDKTSAALGWEYGAKGLNLWGAPRMGKTRTLLMVLEMAFDGQHTFRVFGPKDFALALDNRRFNTAAFLTTLRCCDLLAFDDIGKMRLTPVQEGEFFGLIEYFFACGKPVMFTHNFNGEQLEHAFRNGPAIVGRIREHCQSIHFG